MSVAFTKEDSAETAAETVLPDRVISPHPNLVTQSGLRALEEQLRAAREACEAANAIEDINERRRISASPLRDLRYFSERVRTAQLMPDPPADGVVIFGSLVKFSRDDGRTQRFRIVGEDEADPAAGTMSYVSPVARVLMGKAAGDLVSLGGREIEIVDVA
ncbi:transcription elongation factor GreA [Agrobacterium sp. LMR679]|uniref:transcription elongation factor GreA n=1 Tax=Agrobacterium sp. LMR679 TaxID=3014335 RepID=UPI0022AF6AD4|nr:transcription elongation factor GreA [Agrobacterium sp. LMR679]MCZ4072941.1 transcription elongation factor GreA [Agrobacterium sp. LMR679]